MPQLVYVTNIQKFCTHDGPGIRTNVFFKGCSMECKWCANPETIDPYPQLMYYHNKCTGCGRCIPDCIHEAIKFHHDGSRVEQIPGKCKNCGACVSACRQDAREIVGELKTPEEVFKIVDQDKVFYQQSGGGVTFSGGEPFLHPEFIQKVSAMCKAEGYTTAVETCGNFCLSPVLKIIDLIDHVLFDIKIIDEEKHIRHCGKSNQKIHRNFETLLKLTDVTPRVPIIPGINDTPVDIALLCRFFTQYKDKIKRVHILPYHNLGLGKYEALDEPYSLNDVHPPSDEHMNGIKADLERCGFEVVIGG